MAEWNAGRMRVSIQDDERSVLLTGSTIRCDELVERLESLGMVARALGRLVVACGSVSELDDGTFAEFGDGCRHMNLRDATRHAVHRLSAVLREYGIDPELGDELRGKGFASQSAGLERYSFGARLC
jgi:hypothetical protein